MSKSSLAAMIAVSAFVFSPPNFASSQPCADILKMRSVGGGRKITLNVKNDTASERVFDWINFKGKRENYGRIGPGETARIQTFSGHPWVFSDRDNTCVEGFVPTASRQNFTLTKTATTDTASAKPARVKYAPTASYVEKDINGFKLLVNPDLVKNDRLYNEMLDEFTRQTQRFLQAMPPDKTAILRSFVVWVELNPDPDSVAMFHNSRRWLVDHGLNPDKAGSIEIQDAENFISAGRQNQPLLILHELTHAYQFKFAGKLDGRIARAYAAALAGKSYDDVEYSSGERRRAYALTSKDEYFAELTEAYFGMNDFFPFTRKELEKHDPVGYRLIKSIWGP